MEAEFWHTRWQNHQIGFHQQRINPHLQRFWQQLELQPHARVFVPLCGKSLDMVWLAEQGHSVLGVELSEVAVHSFFHEQDLTASIRQAGAFQIWEAGLITLLCGDFFALDREMLAEVTGVYDRAALIALPPAMRHTYAAYLIALLPAAPQLLVTLEYCQATMQGPPFAVDEDEVYALYHTHYHIERLDEYDVLAQSPRFRERGLSYLNEKIYYLQPR